MNVDPHWLELIPGGVVAIIFWFVRRDVQRIEKTLETLSKTREDHGTHLAQLELRVSALEKRRR